MSKCPHCKSRDVSSVSWAGGYEYPIGEVVTVGKHCNKCGRGWKETTKATAPVSTEKE